MAMDKQKISFSLVLVVGFAISSQSSAIGHVQRDCPQAGTKEAITMAWQGPNQLFYTQAHVLKKGNAVNWIMYESGKGWERTWRSHAGLILNYIQNYYKSGVYGHHYWYNEQAGRVETRRNFVTTCNLETWGWDNW